MQPYVIRQGDYLTRLAWERGFDAEEVWQHDLNRDLAAARSNREVLQPGDVLYIPATASSRQRLRANASHQFRANVPTVQLTLVFEDHGSAIANANAEIRIGTRTTQQTSDGNGQLVVRVPTHLHEIDVHFPEKKRKFRVRVGHVDPVSSGSGQWSRLHQLGYLPQQWHDPHSRERALEAAIRAFQHDMELEVTGTFDNDTRDALEREHRS